jgi:hypothetical protein
MKQLILPLVLASSIATCALLGATPAAPLNGVERGTLTAQTDDSLLSLRAGAPEETADLGGSERENLAQAQAADPGLLDQRGGLYLTREEWMIIAIVLATVLFLVLIT